MAAPIKFEFSTQARKGHTHYTGDTKMKNPILVAAIVIATLTLSACSESNAETRQTDITTSTTQSIQKFTEIAFDQLQLAEKPVLIDIHASWCGVCKKQSAIINEYFANHPNSELTVLKVDYDTQTEWVRYFKAPRQSTLVLYKGSRELGKVIAETNKEKLFSFLNKAG